MENSKSISLSIFILLQIIVSSILGFMFSRNDFWPGIDAIAPVQNMNSSSSQYSTDLFVSSTSNISGRTPYNLVLKILDYLLPGNTEFALSALSALTITSSTSLIFLALLTTIIKRTGTTTHLVPSAFFIAYLVFLFGSLVTPLLPYGHSIYMAGYGPEASPWSTPEYLSMTSGGLGIVLLNTNALRKKNIKMFVYSLLSLATLIHPTSSFFFLFIVALFGLSFKTFNRNEIYIISRAFFTSFFILAFMLAGQANVLSPAEFVEIYAKFRHPHHFVPSNYLNIGNILMYLSAFLLALILCRKSRPHRILTVSLFLLIFISNVGQFVFVEVFPVQLIAAFGPSRISSYALISYYVIIIHFIITNIGLPKIIEKKRTKIPFVINRKVMSCLILLTFGFSTSYVYQDYVHLKERILNQAHSLKLKPGDLILVDSKVSTQGFREFAQVNIWFDFYFMFDLKGIEIYRERWIQSCGPVPISNCQDLLTNVNVRDLSNFMEKNGVKKIVLSAPLDISLIQNNFNFLGYSEDKWSYELKNVD